MTETNFGDLLRRHRIAAGLTQEALAERAGVSTRGISDLERGARELPRKDTLRLLLQALDLAPADRAALVVAARRPPATAPRGTHRPALGPPRRTDAPYWSGDGHRGGLGAPQGAFCSAAHPHRSRWNREDPPRSCSRRTAGVRLHRRRDPGTTRFIRGAVPRRFGDRSTAGCARNSGTNASGGSRRASS